MKCAVYRKSCMLIVLAIGVSAVLSPAVLAQEMSSFTLDDFLGVSKWSQSNWADADVDPDGIVRYVPRIRPNVGPEESPALLATVHFKPGTYSQGVVLHSRPDDWAVWREFAVELMLLEAVDDVTVYAKLIIFPEHRWTEAGDQYAVPLVAGEWVTLRVLLGDHTPTDFWSVETSEADLARIEAYAIKLFAKSIPESSLPVQVVIAQPRLEGPVN